jgi:hypothetical protein
VIPHPERMIKMDLSRDGDAMEGNIDLPGNLNGILIWKDKKVNLKRGTQHISL